MKGEVIINGVDAYTTYGITLSEQAISNLMMPPPLKSYTSNTNAGIAGKEVLGVPHVDERDVTLEISITASSRDTMLTRLAAFTNMLKQGALTIKTRYSDDTYHLLYVSCSQISPLANRIAKFTLKANEPDPTNR